MVPVSHHFVMRSGPTPGKTFQLTGQEITIGRDPSNDITIKDPEVSRQHARLLAQAGEYVLEDLGSTNGTFVNGQRLIGPHLLKTGEMVLFAENVSLVYEEISPDQDATLVSEPIVASTPPATLEAKPAGVLPQSEVQRAEAEVPQAAEIKQPVPPPPFEPEMEPAEPQSFPDDERKSRTGLYAGCGCLIVLLFFVVGAVWVIDSLYLWCYGPLEAIWNGFGFICKQPGALDLNLLITSILPAL
jgi:predicted component of type VI protein secretion system